MNAKEYFKENYPDVFNDIDDQQNPEESVAVPIALLMESYHQAKSKEEAGERYNHAWGLIPKDLNAYIVAQIDRALTLAAFGKEET